MVDVFLTKDANSDLQEIYSYLKSNDAVNCQHVMDSIEDAVQSLSSHPSRGSYPEELLELGIKEFREVYFKPYRIIYKVVSASVFVLVIADGRRDFSSLLQRRLLG